MIARPLADALVKRLSDLYRPTILTTFQGFDLAKLRRARAKAAEGLSLLRRHLEQPP